MYLNLAIFFRVIFNQALIYLVIAKTAQIRPDSKFLPNGITTFLLSNLGLGQGFVHNYVEYIEIQHKIS